MNKKIVILILALFAAAMLKAQDKGTVSRGYETADSLKYSRQDAGLSGKNIFNEMPLVSKGNKADVKIHQSESIAAAMQNHIKANHLRTISGYRVRIFFDNKQNSRMASEAALERFNSKYRDIPAYRSYVNPYFKVTVGDFRTKSEAMQLLERIRGDFPSAFMLKENINYPAWQD